MLVVVAAAVAGALVAVLACICIKRRRPKAAAARADFNVEAPADRNDAFAGDGLEACSVKWLKAEAQARGVSLVGCVEKADMVAALRAAPPVQAYTVPAGSWNVASAAQDAASTTTPPIPSAPPMNAGFAAEPPVHAPTPVYAPSPPPRVPAPSVPTVGVEESKESTPSTHFEELPSATVVERGRTLLHGLLSVGKALPVIGHFCDAAKDVLNSVEKYWEKVDDVKAAGATVVDVLAALKQMSENVEEFQRVDQERLKERLDTLAKKLRLFKGVIDKFGQEGWYKRAWTGRGTQSLVKLDKEIREKLKALDRSYGLVRDAENNARYFDTREWQFRMETKINKLIEDRCASERCDVPTAEAFLVNDPDTIMSVGEDAHVLMSEIGKLQDQIRQIDQKLELLPETVAKTVVAEMKVAMAAEVKLALENDSEVRNLEAEDRNDLSMIAAHAGVPVLCRVIKEMKNGLISFANYTNEGNVVQQYYETVKTQIGIDITGTDKKDKARRKMLYVKVREVAANKGLINLARRIKSKHGGEYEEVSLSTRKIPVKVKSVPSPGYVCHQCGVAGHYVHDCPQKALASEAQLAAEFIRDRHEVELYCCLTQKGEEFLKALNGEAPMG